MNSDKNNFKGWFELKTPEDLLKKLNSDFKRIETNELDSYAAFDFFVTSFHMIDWLYPNNKKEQYKLRNSEIILQICDHLASGAKHFEASADKHRSILDTDNHKGAFSSGFSSGFDISQLEIYLDGKVQEKFGKKIGVLDLAKKVIEFWESYFIKRNK